MDVIAHGISGRALQGYQGQKGLVDKFDFKFELKRTCLGTWLDVYVKDPAVAKTIREKLQDHKTYREEVCPYPRVIPDDGSDPMSVEPEFRPNLSFKATWSTSENKAFGFIEQLIYTTKYDPFIRGALKNGRSVKEFFDTSQVKEAIEEIEKAKAVEEQKRKENEEGQENQKVNGEAVVEANQGDAVETAVKDAGKTLAAHLDDPMEAFVAAARRTVVSKVRLVQAPQSPREVTIELGKSFLNGMYGTYAPTCVCLFTWMDGYPHYPKNQK